jgi:hypothetical protein
MKIEEVRTDGFDPLVRTNVPFGGIINEFKQRIPHYKSDITDAFNAMAVAATIFIFFAALAGAIAFGGLMRTASELFKGRLGVIITNDFKNIFALTNFDSNYGYLGRIKSHGNCFH